MEETQVLDGLILPKFISMYITLYIFGYFTVFRNWDSKIRAEASSSLLSLFHGIPAVLLSLYSIFILPQPQLHFASPNTAFQDLVLEYSIAYFLIDTLHYLVFKPSDGLFIAHHLAVLYVFATCRYVICHGAFSLILLLVLAEITSPCQNAWSLARYRKAEAESAKRFYEAISPWFYGFYSVVRGVLGPMCVCSMVVFYVNGGGEGLVPRWAWVSWMAVIVCAILLSMLWVLNLWIKFFRERTNTTKARKLS